MDLGLKDRVALVTGGSRGIGRAIAFGLAAEGCNLIICGRDPIDLQIVCCDIKRQYSVQAFICQVDVERSEDVSYIFRKIIPLLSGKLDILVNNAGGNQDFISFEEVAEETWINAWRLNFLSVALVTQEAIPYILKSDQGRIINISSLVGLRPGFMNPHYGSAKSAVLNLSAHLARRYSKQGITVNSICPNTVKGGLWKQNVEDKAKKANITFAEAEAQLEKEVLAKSGASRMCTVEDIASLVTFLASSRAGFLNGLAIRVDGGEARTMW